MKRYIKARAGLETIEAAITTPIAVLIMLATINLGMVIFGQQAVQAAVRDRVPQFDHGARRRDPSATIEQDGLFRLAARQAWSFTHRTPRVDFVRAFRAHATLVRQAGAQFPALLADIDAISARFTGPGDLLEVPFVTRLWLATAA